MITTKQISTVRASKEMTIPGGIANFKINHTLSLIEYMSMVFLREGINEVLRNDKKNNLLSR